MIKIAIDNEDGIWVAKRGIDVLAVDDHRDLVFLAATTYANNGETIEVYDDNGTFDFSFEVSDIVWD